MSSPNYEPLLASTSDSEGAESELPRANYEPTTPRTNRHRRIIRALAALNVLLATLLCISVLLLWRRATSAPSPPYSSAWEAVRYVNKRFQREEMFHIDDETSPELDAAWKNLTGPSNGHVRLPMNEARKNVPTLELHYDQGYYLYGVSMFHQMHCLDTLRKSFYPEHYFPGKTKDEVRIHKNHCLDHLRQSIMCSGDVTLDHWFDYAFTEPSFDPSSERQARGVDWTESYSAEYWALTPRERSLRSNLLWDTLHQCRDYDALWTWVRDRQLVNTAYEEEFNRTDDVS